jgi:autotransporter-associated beta strand protein
MGGLTNAFIKAGGAKFDTGFDITVSQVLLEDPVSTGGGLTKEGASTLILSGANTYTGVTNVNAGTLQLGNASALGTTAGNTIVASGARIFAQNGVSNQIVPEPITLSGTGTDGTGALRFGGGVAGVTMSGPITLGADTLIKSDGSTSATFSGGISISDKVLTFATDSGATNTVSTAGISGTTGSVVKTGTGTLTLAAAGTFSGGTSHEGGIINVNDSNALGSGTAALNGGIRYVIGDGVDVANAFALGANAGTAGNGLIQVATGTTGTVSGPINITSGAAGGGHFASAGTGVLNITGPITSTTTVSNRNGTVVHSGGGTGYTTTNVGQGTVRLGANDGIATTATMTIAASAAAFFDLAGFNQSMVGVLKGGFAATIGNSSETSDSTLTLTGTSSYAGVIQDVLGTGTMKLNLAVSGGNFTVTGNNTYSGPTTVTNGTLLVNNTTGSGTGTSAVTVNAGTLGGTGIISGAVTMGDGTGSADSVLAPGSAGIESLDTGALVFASDASYSVEVDGTSATSDQTIVTGSVAIDAATTLSVNVSGTLVGGQKFFIVVNDDVDAVSGTFATFGQDALVGTFGGINLKISYTGDSVGNTTTGGNDIVLYAEAASTPYGDWAIAKGLDGTPGKEAGKADDPDKDGKNNLHEFAFDGDPLSGANDGKVVGKVATVGGDDVLTLTLPVRNGATFTTDSGDLVSDTTDGVVYRIEGDTSLDPFADAITEVTPALDGGLPALSTGWTYRTFRAPGKVGTDPKAFLRAKVSSDTP